jgi:hypothetical protein
VRCIEIWIDGIAVRKLSTIDKNANRGGAIRRIGEGYNRLRGLPDLRGANYYWQGAYRDGSLRSSTRCEERGNQERKSTVAVKDT